MESRYTKLALCGSKNECARTDTVFFPISEVSEGTVSLTVTIDAPQDMSKIYNAVCRKDPATPVKLCL